MAVDLVVVAADATAAAVVPAAVVVAVADQAAAMAVAVAVATAANSPQSKPHEPSTTNRAPPPQPHGLRGFLITGTPAPVWAKAVLRKTPANLPWSDQTWRGVSPPCGSRCAV